MDKKNNSNDTRKHFHNIVNALDKAQTKGVFTLGQSAFIFQSLQKISEFIDMNDNNTSTTLQNSSLPNTPSITPSITPSVTPSVTAVQQLNSTTEQLKPQINTPQNIFETISSTVKETIQI